MSLKILILGVNGFIGSALVERILATTDWEIYGMDLTSHKIEEFLNNPRLHFHKGDIKLEKKWISEHIQKCDVVFPLVAVANPSVYVSDPLFVFELDFEANLSIVRACVHYKKHLVFPSTSEVYGMSMDVPFDEEESRLVLGPINKQRWIYSCSKQLMDRVIYAYGEKEGLNYTLFRPFNWIGPKLDNILAETEGSARALSQFLGNILQGKDIQLVDGGKQRRCFTYIDDGIDGLMQIIKRRDKDANQRIFNLGCPTNDFSIKELAEMLVKAVAKYPKYSAQAKKVKLIEVSNEAYFGKGYQDVLSRVPAIKNAQKYLDWTPKVNMQQALQLILDYHLKESKE